MTLLKHCFDLVPLGSVNTGSGPFLGPLVTLPSLESYLSGLRCFLM